MENLKYAFKWLTEKKLQRGPTIISVIYAVVSWNMVVYVLYVNYKSMGLVDNEAIKAAILKRHSDNNNIYTVTVKGLNFTQTDATLENKDE